MAGTAITASGYGGAPVTDDLLDKLREEHNKIITDLESLRASGGTSMFSYKVEDLAADADLTERAFFRAPVALTVTGVYAIQEAASAGVDGSNTAVITVQNITATEVVATITLTSDVSANAATVVTITGANADIAAGDVLGVVVTQGTTADLGSFVLQVEYQAQAVDAAADLTAATIAIAPG